MCFWNWFTLEEDIEKFQGGKGSFSESDLKEERHPRNFSSPFSPQANQLPLPCCPVLCGGHALATAGDEADSAECEDIR